MTQYALGITVAFPINEMAIFITHDVSCDHNVNYEENSHSVVKYS